MKPALSGNLPASVTSSRGVIECEKKRKNNIQRARTAFVDSVTGPGVKTQIGFKGGCERCVEGKGGGGSVRVRARVYR